MRAPGFWNREPERPALATRILAPLGALYARATARRIAGADGYRPGVPVICVGNLNAGGTGKTPAVIALIQRLKARGKTPAVISRGHGGRFSGPVEVREKMHSYRDVGDEPLLIAAFARTWIGKNRAAAARAAESAGVDVILMDDGFQNPSVDKDISIVVVDAATGFGNGRCIPAGPLREPVAAGLDRADLVLSVGPDDMQKGFAAKWGHAISVPHLTGRLVPLETGMDWTGTPLLAFAGIGHPEKFFVTLQDLRADLAKCEALDDHQPLTVALMARLEREAERLGAQLVTTEKDAVRLPEAYRRKVLTVPVRLEIDDRAPLDAAFQRSGL